MNLTELLNQITDLGNRIRAAASQLATQANDPNVSLTALEEQRSALDSMNRRMAALQAAYQTQQATEAAGIQPMGTVSMGTYGAVGSASVSGEPQQSRELSDMLRSREYARAFAYAIQNGVSRKNGRSNEQVKILFDALTESGGTPVGTDGGFLVPEDIDHTIQEQRRALNPLADLFGEENVTAPTGWRVMDTAPNKGLVDVDEMGEIDDDDDQPAFAKNPYSCTKKALILPVSNELATDNVANLFSYLGRWFAKKLVITENTMLLTALRSLTAASIASNPLGGIKTALNVGLDPAISAMATIICNQSGYDALDQLLDDNKRPLLQPDPTSATRHTVKGRAVHAVSNAVMGNVTSGSGQTATTTSDFFIGYGKEFATLFRCGSYELASTDIGGNAWRTDSTELRGIARLGVSKFDTGAMLRRNITL